MTALAHQEGGSHYKTKAIQPIQLGMANRYDPCTFSSIKYVTRHRDKSGKQDLLKARHFIQLRLETLGLTGGAMIAKSEISVEKYCEENALPELEADIVKSLHYIATLAHAPASMLEVLSKAVIGMIDSLIEHTYPEDKP